MKSAIQHLLEHNMLAKFSYVAKHKSDMALIKTDSATLINSYIPCDMFNIIAGISVTKASELKWLFNDFTKRNLPFALWTGFATENEVTLKILSATSLPQVENEMGMSANINSIKAINTNSKLIIRPVSSPKALKDVITVMCHLLPSQAQAISRYFSKASDVIISSSSKLTFYVGYLNGEPIATSALYRDEVCAGIWDVMTLAKVRRQGVGATMTYSTAMQAKAKGYDVVVLTASDEGLRIYEKMGFNKLNAYSVFNIGSER